MKIPTKHSLIFAAGISLLLGAPVTSHLATAQENTLYWTNNRSPETRNMQQRENWSDAANSLTSAAAGPTADSNLVFNANARNTTDQTPQLAAGDREYRSMTFRSSGSTQIDRGASTSTSSNVLTLSHGITVDAGAGSVNFGRSGQIVWMRASQDMAITHNGSSLLSFNNRWESAGPDDTTVTLTVNGAGSGRVVFNVVRDITTSDRRLGLTIDRAADSGFVSVISGTYSGPTLVQGGTFRLGEDSPGTLTGSDVTVTGNGRIINRGTITDGSLHFGPGGGLGINANLTLMVNGSGTVSFDGFGINNISFTVGSWDTLALNTPYTVIGGNAFFDYSGLLNVGEANAIAVGDTGRSAFFEIGNSVSLVVIPEPGTFVLLAGILSFGGVLVVRRRLRK